MEIIIEQTPEGASQIAARAVARLLRRKATAVLGLATGSTPLLLYHQLLAMKLDWRHIKTFNLDEYVGLSGDHPQSYRAYMNEHLFQHINIPLCQTHVPNGIAADIPGCCEQYEQSIREAGGIDLQILGIGSDGHIGFNEPTSSLASRTRIKTLTLETRRDNARFFANDEAVPKHVITMGIGTILEAREIVLLAFGESKAAAIAGALEGPLTSMNPASALQMHPSVMVCIDEPAASRLAKADYYRWVYANKPEWQRL
jgi:glucosamine-6-phosphate deaminase